MLDLTKLDKTKDMIIYNIPNNEEAAKVKNFLFNTDKYEDVSSRVLRWSPSRLADNFGGLCKNWSKKEIINFYKDEYLSIIPISIRDHIFYDYQNDTIDCCNTTNNIFIKRTKIIKL